MIQGHISEEIGETVKKNVNKYHKNLQLTTDAVHLNQNGNASHPDRVTGTKSLLKILANTQQVIKSLRNLRTSMMTENVARGESIVPVMENFLEIVGISQN